MGGHVLGKAVFLILVQAAIAAGVNGLVLLALFFSGMPL